MLRPYQWPIFGETRAGIRICCQGFPEGGSTVPGPFIADDSTDYLLVPAHAYGPLESLAASYPGFYCRGRHPSSKH